MIDFNTHPILKTYKNFIFFGMFGSGKTEISLSFVRTLKTLFELVAIADIDTVSPFFRSRDEKAPLEAAGIRVMVPPFPFLHGDLPIIVPEVGGFLQNEAYRVVVDVGGDDDGATVLGSLSRFAKEHPTAVFFVANTKRPFSETPNAIIHNMYRLSQKSRMSITAIIHNTHLQAETTLDMIAQGEAILREVSEATKVPVFATVLQDSLARAVSDHALSFPTMTIHRYLKTSWE
ncbi:MAG TPA: cobalamin biosynthesis protein CobQ [Thermotogota bacterium]|nr:cobalamin biosynthesis protein CobQ [Thermotogota bacterium]